MKEGTPAPKHNTALKMMMRWGWRLTTGLGKNEQGMIAPIKAEKNVRRQHNGAEETRTEEEMVVEACVNSLQQITDEWNKLEMNEERKRREIRGFNNIFEDRDYEEVENGSNLPLLPEAKAHIDNTEVHCLIDTGSQITCVAQEFYENYLNDKVLYPIMPVTAIQIRVAVGHKSQRISRLVLVPLRFGDVTINTPCLIIPKLIRPIILGVNWLDEYTAEFKCGENRRLKIKTGNGKKEIELVNSSITHRKTKGEISGQNCTRKNLNNIEINSETNETECLESRITTFVSELKLDLKGKEGLGKILIKHKDVFIDRPGLTNLYTHEIKMTDDTPFVKRSYPVPFAYRDKVDEKIRELEFLGIISREATQFSSPLTFTMKKDGTVRLLLDARLLNSKMCAEVEKPPLTTEIIQRFHGVKYITTIDLNSAYFQIPISRESRKYTGFVYNGKSYVYKVLPQGLKTSVGSFSRAMDKILGPGVREFCANYLDDLIIYTCGSQEEHFEHIGAVLDRLEAANMTCKLEKCQFLFTEVRMLGHIITPFGVQMDPEKIEAIKNFPVPKKIKQVRAFLGLCNYYRRFANKYGETTRILCDLLQKNRAWHWGEAEQRAFERVKSLFLESVILHHHDPNSTYYLQTDSSGFAIGGELYQLDEQGDHHVIGFISKALRGPELKWTTSEQELWAIIYALHKFETYLRGVHLIIRTDHQALTFLKSWKMYSGRLTRWILYLNQFNFTVEYVKGKENIGPDILSRYSCDAENVQEEKNTCPEIAAFAVKSRQQIRKYLENIIELQKQDAFLGEIYGYLRNKKFGPPTKDVNRYLKNYKKIGKTLYYTTGQNKTVLAVPKELTEELIKMIHLEIGHGGMFKTGSAMGDRYYWPGMNRDIKRIVKGCHLCQLAKREIRPTVGPSKSIITKEIGQLAMADLYGPLPRGTGGVRFIFVIQDSFSRFVKLYKLRIASTRTVLNCVEDFNKTIHIEALLTDNGSQFTSKKWESNLDRMGIRILHTSVRNPGPNITERVNKELGRIFRIYCHEKHTKWVAFLKEIEQTYNNSIHCSTGFSPNEIAFGKSPTYSLDKYTQGCGKPTKTIEEIKLAAQKNLEKSAANRQKYYNLNKRLVNYEIGTMVKLRKITQSSLLKKEIKKFHLLYEGPFVIGSIPYSNTYTLIDPKTREIKGDYSAIHLARYYTSNRDQQPSLELMEIIE